MKANKIGIVFVVAVLGLAGVGASYAGFVDIITIEGTVTTGTVDLEIVALSGTWAWKMTYDKIYDMEMHELIIHHDWIGEEVWPEVVVAGETFYDVPMPMTDPLLPGYSYELIAWAVAEETEDDKITMTWNNLFPLQDKYEPYNWFIIDALFHYNGKIPARLQGFEPPYYGITWEPGSEWIYDLVEHDYVWAKAYEVDQLLDEPLPQYPDMYNEGETVYPGHQFHYCDFFKLDIFVNIPQDIIFPNDPWRDWGLPSYQGLAASGSCTFALIQFDEYMGPVDP